jgi:hypothetical protein
MYFEGLACLHAAAAKSGDAEAVGSAERDIAQRLARLRDPRNLVMVLATLTQRRQVAPAVAAAVEARFTGEGGADALGDLDARYLTALAYAAAVQGATNKAFFEALAARAGALGGFEPADHANLGWALGKAGVPLPPGVTVASEEGGA